jgi:alkylation response protein AidB-like acyl-CoA dehydrogenase
MALLAAGAAAQKFMQKLANEQEIIAMIADMIIEIYAMESALLRAQKKAAKEGEEKAALHIAATRVYINDTLPKIDFNAKQILATIAEGEELRTQLMGIKKLGKYTPINTIALRRQIAESAIPVARYNLTKL